MDYIAYLLLILLLAQMVISFLERRDLVDRLMAKDFKEYKDETEPVEENELEDEDDGLAELDEAREEIDGAQR